MPAVDQETERHEITAEIFGMRAKAASSDRRFAEAVGSRFEPYCRSSAAGDGGSAAHPAISAVLSVRSGSRRRRAKEEAPCGDSLFFGRHLRRAGDRWIWRRSKALHGLEVSFRFIGGQLDIEGTLRERRRFFGMFGGTRSGDIWTHCADTLFLMPILARAFRVEGWMPVHGSALAIRGKGVLIAGLAGCGKTTLAASILAGSDAVYLGENLALVRSGLIWGLASPLRLDRKSVELIGKRKLACAADEWPEASVMLGSGRSQCFRPKRLSIEPFPLGAVLFPRIGPETGFRALRPAEAEATLRLMESLTYEMEGFRSWLGVLDLAAEDASAPYRSMDESGRFEAGNGHTEAGIGHAEVRADSPEALAGSPKVAPGSSGGFSEARARHTRLDGNLAKGSYSGRLPFDAPMFEITLGIGMSAGMMQELAGRIFSEVGI